MAGYPPLTPEEMEDAARIWNGQAPIGVGNSVPMATPGQLGMQVPQYGPSPEELEAQRIVRERARLEDAAANEAAYQDALAEMQTDPRVHGNTPQGTSGQAMGGSPLAPSMRAPAGGQPTAPGLDWKPPPEQAPYVDLNGPPGQQPPLPTTEPPPGVVYPGSGAAGGGGGSRLRGIEREQKGIAGRYGKEADAAQAGVGAVTEEQKANIAAGGEITQRNTARQVETMDARNKALEESGKGFQKQRDLEKGKLEKEQGELRKLDEEISKVEIKDRRTTMQRVMGALAVVLGGMADAQVAAGGGTPQDHAGATYKMIRDAIDRDLEVQRANLASKQANRAAKFSEVGLAREAVKDVDQAELLAENAIIRKHQAALERVQAEGAGELATNAAQGAALQLEADLRKNNAQIARNKAEKAEDRAFAVGVKASENEDQAAAAARAAIAKAAMTPKEIMELKKLGLEIQLKEQEVKAGATKSDIAGYERTREVPTNQAEKAVTIAAAGASLREDFRRLAEIRARNSGGTWDRDDVAEAQRIMDSMPAKFSNMYGAGAPSLTEFAKFEETLIDPTRYWAPWRADPTEAYTRAVDHLGRIEREQLKYMGYEPAQTYIAPSLYRQGSGLAPTGR